MSKILIVPDKFKGSFTSNEISMMISRSIKKYAPNNEIIRLPIADGGDGFLAFFQYYHKGKTILASVHNSLMEPIITEYFLRDDGVAIIESAKVIGLQLIKDKLNPLKTSSFGLGELILSAYNDGIKEFYVGIGGSSTNDAGFGLLQALGYLFKDKNGNLLDICGKNLGDIAEIDVTGAYIKPDDITIKVFHDVTNPLTGENGASLVYSKQKGATRREQLLLENQMLSLQDLLEKKYRINTFFTGAGASGGLSIALHSFLKGEMKPGIDSLLAEIKIDQYLEDASLVITGEGVVDHQSFNGKVLNGLLKHTVKQHKEVIAIVGANHLEQDTYPELKLKIVELHQDDESIQHTIEQTPHRIDLVIKQLFSK